MASIVELSAKIIKTKLRLTELRNDLAKANSFDEIFITDAIHFQSCFLEEYESQKRDQVTDLLDDVIHMQDTLDENSDGSDRLEFETEVTCLEQHTGVKLHKLLEDHHVRHEA